MKKHINLAVLLFCFSQISLADFAPVLIGKWKGISYGCSQGVPTHAEIEVYENLSAVFRFYASDSRLGQYESIFHATLQRNEDTVIFEPISSGIAAWFIKPSGSWVSIGFNATLR